MTTQGAKWIRRSTRCAIYNRDNHQCLFCGEADAALTLDHVVARELGGRDSADNLVTACLSCNSAKQAKTMRAWLRYLREAGQCTAGLSQRVRRQLGKALDRKRGRQLAVAIYGAGCLA